MASTWRLSYAGESAGSDSQERLRPSTSTYNLIDHNENSRLGVLGALHIPIDGDSEALVQAIVGRIAVGGNHRTVCIMEFGGEQENVGSGVGGQGIHVFQDAGTNALG